MSVVADVTLWSTSPFHPSDTLPIYGKSLLRALCFAKRGPRPRDLCRSLTLLER